MGPRIAATSSSKALSKVLPGARKGGIAKPTKPSQKHVGTIDLTQLRAGLAFHNHTGSYGAASNALNKGHEAGETEDVFIVLKTQILEGSMTQPEIIRLCSVLEEANAAVYDCMREFDECTNWDVYTLKEKDGAINIRAYYEDGNEVWSARVAKNRLEMSPSDHQEVNVYIPMQWSKHKVDQTSQKAPSCHLDIDGVNHAARSGLEAMLTDGLTWEKFEEDMLNDGTIRIEAERSDRDTFSTNITMKPFRRSPRLEDIVCTIRGITSVYMVTKWHSHPEKGANLEVLGHYHEKQDANKAVRRYLMDKFGCDADWVEYKQNMLEDGACQIIAKNDTAEEYKISAEKTKVMGRANSVIMNNVQPFSSSVTLEADGHITTIPLVYVSYDHGSQAVQSCPGWRAWEETYNLRTTVSAYIESLPIDLKQSLFTHL